MFQKTALTHICTRAAHLVATLSLVALAACGGRSIDSPESLAPGEDVQPIGNTQLTFIMQSCRSPCATYEMASCEVDVNNDKLEIDIDASVSFEEDRNIDDAGSCDRCSGAPILAHCQLTGLRAGTYTVTAGSLKTTIEVR